MDMMQMMTEQMQGHMMETGRHGPSPSDHFAARLLCDARAASAECGSNDVLALLAARRLVEQATAG